MGQHCTAPLISYENVSLMDSGGYYRSRIQEYTKYLKLHIYGPPYRLYMAGGTWCTDSKGGVTRTHTFLQHFPQKSPRPNAT